MEWLASPEAAAIWAAEGGFLSPDESVVLDTCPAGPIRKARLALSNPNATIRFDLSDQQPFEFGSATDGRLYSYLRVIPGSSFGARFDSKRARIDRSESLRKPTAGTKP